VIAHVAYHWIKAERREAGLRKIIETGQGQRSQPGLVSRQVFVSIDDPLKVTSISVWQNQAAIDAWRRHPDYAIGRDGLAENWSRSTEHEYYDVVDG
jgi:heme-degrading monooxygenase HmoA